MTKTFNIAFEISSLLSLTGENGEKSGIFELQFNLIKELSNYLSNNKLKHQIYLYSLNPTFFYNLNKDVYDLLQLKNVQLVKIELTDFPKYQKESSFNVPYLSYIYKKVKSIYQKRVIEKKFYFNYFSKLNNFFTNKNIKVVHHSETQLFPFSNVSNVVNINDLVPIKFPHWSTPEIIENSINKLKFVKNNCQGVICISQSTCNDLKAYFNNELETKTIVIYPGANIEKTNHTFSELNQVINQLGYSEIKSNGYYLFFGTKEPRKNIYMLSVIFRKLIQNKQLNNFKLVLVGGKGWGNIYNDINNLINETYFSKKYSPILNLGYLNKELLTLLIKNAYATIYPSFYEGFGLPVLESMKYGTPVITSNNSSLPEVIEKAGITINPLESKELELAILKLSNDLSLRNELSEKAKKQADKFSWPKTAEQVFSFYNLLQNS